MKTVLQEDLDIIASYKYDELENKRIFITGASGLIGVALVRSLLAINDKNQMNIQVIGMVRNVEKAKKIYGELLNRGDFELCIGDVNQNIHYLDRVDYIFHCASVTASNVMISQPVETIITAIEGTKNVLNFAKEKKIKSLVYISSMEMYGSFETRSDEITEKDIGYIDPLCVRSNYPESKRLCENMCIAYLNEYQVPAKIARLAQTFGAGILQEENRVFAQFAKSVLRGEDIILHTLGKSEGNYCYTRDTVNGLLTILLKGENGEAYNVSNPDSHTTISDMAHMVADNIAGGRIKVIYDIPEKNIYGYAADTKMKLNSNKLQALGWKPEVGLEEAFRRLISSMGE